MKVILVEYCIFFTSTIFNTPKTVLFPIRKIPSGGIMDEEIIKALRILAKVSTASEIALIVKEKFDRSGDWVKDKLKELADNGLILKHTFLDYQHERPNPTTYYGLPEWEYRLVARPIDNGMVSLEILVNGIIAQGSTIPPNTLNLKKLL